MTDKEITAALDALIGGNCVGLSLRRAARRVSRRYDKALVRHGLTIGQLGILASIKGWEIASVQELADFFDMDQSAMSRSLNPLSRNGLVEDKPSAADRRRRQVSLTDLGETLLRDAAKTWHEVQSQLLNDLNAKEPDFRALLNAMANDEEEAPSFSVK